MLNNYGIQTVLGPALHDFKILAEEGVSVTVAKYVPGHGAGSMLPHKKACKSKQNSKLNTIATKAGFVVTPTKRVISVVDKSDLTDCLAYKCEKDEPKKSISV